MQTLDLSFGGRYDDYSEGFSHFSPKIGVKFTPIKQVALRGTWSEGFRAPTFAESGPRSQYAGFSTFTPPAAYIAAHGGASNSYVNSFQLGQGLNGNPNLKPEISHAFTVGLVAQPFSWLSATVDYYQVKKDDLIVAGAQSGQAKDAYFANPAATIAQACAAVAAVGPGYSCNTIDAVDPLFPTALPRLLIVNAPFVNANSFETTGIDFSITGKFNLPYDMVLVSKLEATKTIKADLTTDSGNVQRYAGTLGPYELSSGNGTPKLRGNWQNTLNWSDFRFSTTTYFVDKIKSVATDEGNLSTDCSANLYTNSAAAPDAATRFCYIKRFFVTDVNAEYQIKEGLTAYLNVGNVFDQAAPVAPAAYSSAPNYLITWHTPGVIGRTYKAGLRFEF
jgi:iron complex outermembrane receptor protein